MPEILFGGARGGGKTDGVLGKFGIKAKRYGKHFNAVFFRKEMPQQDDLIERAKEIYCPLGAKYQDQKKMFTMPWGGRVRFRPLESRADAEKYQGQSLSDAAIEEAGNYPAPDPIDRLNGVLRSAKGVPTQLIMTANPGGPGQQWIKERFIDPAPMGLKVLERILPNKKIHKYTYIPSRLINNPYLMQDEDYVNRLYLVGSPELVRAWLQGDWDAIEGAYFPEFSPFKHVIRPFEIPEHWARIRAMDWGSAKPFCVLWGAVSDGDNTHIPRGAIVIYREWYGSNGTPNVGLKMDARLVGLGIRQRDMGENMSDEVLDPAAFTNDGGPSIAERLDNNWRRADNARVARNGAMGGWDQVRQRLVGDESPQLYIFNTCTNLIRTLPALQHDPNKPEDVDTDSEDHACFAAGTIVNGLPIEQIGVMTKRSSNLIQLVISNGETIVCTPDHLFLTSIGWLPAKDLLSHQLLLAPKNNHFSGLTIISVALITSAKALDCIALFGNTIMEISQMASIFITKMKIGIITILGTLNAWLIRSIAECIPHRMLMLLETMLERKRQSGIKVMLADNGIESTGMKPLGMLWLRLSQRLARYAGGLMRLSVQNRVFQNTAIKTVEHPHCVSVERLPEKQPVYCLASKNGALFVAGVIASNCDTLRYLCMSRPMTKDKPRDNPARFETQLTINEILKRQTAKRLAE